MIKPKNSYKVIYKAAFAVFIGIIIYFANSQHHEAAKSHAQINYENWLTETEAKTRGGISSDTLPALSLTFIPSSESGPIEEQVINSENVPSSKEKILRLLSLINEAGLYDFQTEKPLPEPGDILLKVQSPDKTFNLKFKQEDIAANIKAVLLLKLFEEYIKEKVPKNMAKANTKSSVAGLKDNIFQMFEEESKTK